MSDRQSRREFMGLAAAGIAGIVAGPRFAELRPRSSSGASWHSPAEDPDLIVFNGKVYTVDARLPRAEAFAVTGGRFVAVGSTSEIKGLARKGTQTIDAARVVEEPGDPSVRRWHVA